MKTFVFLITLTLLFSYSQADKSCTSELSPAAYDCTSPGIFTTANLPNFPSAGTKKVTILFDFQAVDFCPSAATFYPLQMQYYSAANAQFYNALNFQFTYDSYYGYFAPQLLTQGTSSSTGLTANYNHYTSAVKGSWYALSGSIDITIPQSGFGAFSQSNTYESYVGSLPVTSDAIIDSNIRMTLCKLVKCKIENLRIFYDYYNTYPNSLALAPIATRIGYYPLLEGSGNLLTDSQGGIAYLGSSKTIMDATASPTWLSSPESGLIFDTTAKYVTLPLFTVPETSSTGGVVRSSATITMWIKITTLPSSGQQYIFRYTSSDKSTDRMALKVSSAGNIVGIFRGASGSFSPVLITGIWTQVSVTFGYQRSTSNGYRFSIIYGAIGKTWSSAGSDTNVNTLPAYQATDQVLLGGFVGQIAELSIYAPGGVFRDASCNPTTCQFDLGFSNPPICNWKICDAGTYLFKSDCVDCPLGCATCTNPQTCQTCSTGFKLNTNQCTQCPTQTYASGANCLPCSVTNCDICSAASTCYKCKTSFTLTNNQCVCSKGTYLDAGTCKTCDSKCSECTALAICQACNDPFALDSTNNNQCVCKTGTYPDAGTCKPCDSKCSKCTTLTTCQACNSPFILNGSNQCVCKPTFELNGSGQCVCPKGTYLDAGTATCKTCDSKCSECTALKTCQACNDPFVINDQNQCVCSEGTYLDGNTCKLCDSKCSACTSATVCTACKSGYIVKNWNCEEVQVTSESSKLIIYVIILAACGAVIVASLAGAYYLFRYMPRRTKVSVTHHRVSTSRSMSPLSETTEVKIKPLTSEVGRIPLRGSIRAAFSPRNTQAYPIEQDRII